MPRLPRQPRFWLVAFLLWFAVLWTLSSFSLNSAYSPPVNHFDKVEQDRTELVVTRQNHEPVVVLPLAELEGLRETLHLLSTPANAERLRRSIAELDAGQGIERILIGE